MKYLIFLFVAVGISFAPGIVLADALDDAFVFVKTFESEEGADPLKLIEAAVIEGLNGTPEERGAVEAKLITALNGATTRRGKDFLCRQMRIVGTAKSVPALEKLLGDPQLSHPARYALASMKLPEATAALHRALQTAPEAVKPGLLESLGHLGHEPAIPDAVGLLGSENALVAQAAGMALGRIGNPDGIKALREKFDGGTKSLAHALLLGAGELAANNRPAEAQAIFESLASGNHPAHLQMAALAGLARAGGGSESLARKVMQAIESDDAELSGPAIGVVPLVKGEAATAAFVGLLAKLPAEKKAILVRMLAQRNDSASQRAVQAQLKSESDLVQVAALESISPASAAAAFRDDSGLVTEFLTMVARGSDGVRRAAEATLIQFDAGPATDEILLSALAIDDTDLRIAAIEVIGKRAQRNGLSSSPGANGMVLSLTQSESADVRKAAILAAGDTAEPEGGELKLLIERLLAPVAPGDREGLTASIAKVIARAVEPAGLAGQILSELAEANVESQPSVVSLLSGTPSEAALAAVSGLIREGNDANRDAAVRALSNWQDKAAVPELVTLAKDESASNRDRILAVRGYISLSGKLENPESALHDAFVLAPRVDEKKLALGELANVGGVESLALLEDAMKVDAIKNEAGFALVRIAGRVAGSAPDKVIPLMEAVLKSEDQLPRRIARDARRALDAATKAKEK